MSSAEKSLWNGNPIIRTYQVLLVRERIQDSWTECRLFLGLRNKTFIWRKNVYREAIKVVEKFKFVSTPILKESPETGKNKNKIKFSYMQGNEASMYLMLGSRPDRLWRVFKHWKTKFKNSDKMCLSFFSEILYSYVGYQVLLTLITQVLEMSSES